MMQEVEQEHRSSPTDATQGMQLEEAQKLLRKAVSSKWFEGAIMAVIWSSAFCLAVQSPFDDPNDMKSQVS